MRHRGLLAVGLGALTLALAAPVGASPPPSPSTSSPPAPTTTSPAPTTSTTPTPAAPTTTPATGAGPSPSSPGSAPPSLDTTTTTAPPDLVPPRLRVRVTHPHFSPNGDRVREKVFLALHADEAVTVDITIRNAANTARKVLHLTLGPGDQTVTWGGRIQRANGSWGRAADGDYTVKLVARDAAGNKTKKLRTVTVDTRPPSFAWTGITPDPWGATGAVTYSFVSHDASPPLSVQGTASSRVGLIDRSSRVSRPQGAVRLAWRPDEPDGSVLLPGNYFGAVRVTDDAGNALTSPFRAYRVDRPVSSVAVRRADGAGNRVAVTFDDCNDGAAWSSILGTLRAYGAGGTFFCPGDQVYAHPAQAQATVAAGHSVGSHSNGHAQLTRLSYGEVAGRLAIDKAAWWSVARATPTPYFRPPYGSYNSTVLAAAGDQGFRYTVIWDVDPTDYASPGAGVIASRVLGAVRPGSIVLLHVKGQTAAALPTILSGLRARGLQPVTLAQLFAANGWR